MFTDYQADDGAVTEYGRRGRYIIQHVLAENARGVWLPLLAFCKGFNMLAFFVSGAAHWRDLLRDDFDAMDLAGPLVFNDGERDRRTTKFYQAAESTNSAPYLTEGANLMNRHPYGITPSTYRANANLTRVLGAFIATTLDKKGREFVSVVEHPTYPIYGAATHPEKVLFEWRRTISTPHSSTAFHANLWFAKLLGDDARRNQRAFPSEAEAERTLTYSHALQDMRQYVNGEFRQGYFHVLKSPTPENAPASTEGDLGAAIIAIVGTIVCLSCCFGAVMYRCKHMRQRSHSRSFHGAGPFVQIT